MAPKLAISINSSVPDHDYFQPHRSWGAELNMSRRGMPRACVCALAFSLTGCAGAPTFNFAGAYFPAWMLCAFVGIGAGIVARLLFVKHAMTTLFPYQLMVCVSISVIVAVVTWLVFFGL